MASDNSIYLRLGIYAVTLMFLIIYGLRFEATPGNGGKKALRLLLMPHAFTWLMVLCAAGVKMSGRNDLAVWFFGAAGLVTVLSLLALSRMSSWHNDKGSRSD